MSKSKKSASDATLTNQIAANLVEEAVRIGKVLTVKCPNGDVVTASSTKVIRWGKSRWALPSGKYLVDGFVVPGEVGCVVVEHCGRGNAARAAREAS